MYNIFNFWDYSFDIVIDLYEYNWFLSIQNKYCSKTFHAREYSREDSPKDFGRTFYILTLG